MASPAAPPPAPPHDLITTASALAALVEEVRSADAYAIDTEFHRERTYFPQLALIQIEVNDVIHLVDPLAIDPTAMRPMFESDALAILHAARQDLEVIEHATGAPPRRVFDTQLAAGFLGYSSPSLSSLLEGELGVRAPKADRLTDWLRRPLTEAGLVGAQAEAVNAALGHQGELVHQHITHGSQLAGVAVAAAQQMGQGITPAVGEHRKVDRNQRDANQPGQQCLGHIIRAKPHAGAEWVKAGPVGGPHRQRQHQVLACLQSFNDPGYVSFDPLPMIVSHFPVADQRAHAAPP